MRNIEKIMSQIMIELNRQIFYDQNDNANFVNIKRWIFHENILFFYDKIVKKWKLKQKFFSIEKLLKIILENVKKKRIIIWNLWQTIFFFFSEWWFKWLMNLWTTLNVERWALNVERWICFSIIHNVKFIFLFIFCTITLNIWITFFRLIK